MVKKIGIILIGFLIVPFAVGIIEARNFALGKDCTVLSGINPNHATDGRISSRWASDWNNTEWIKVDLGELQTFNTVILRWESAYGATYNIRFSNDDSDWTRFVSVNGEDGGTDNINFTEKEARYVMMEGIAMGTDWGYSLWEFEVHNVFPVTNLAFEKEAAASSVENGWEFLAGNVIDGDIKTRWASQHSDPQWIKIDLGSAQNINAVVLRWEGAFALDYAVKVSLEDLTSEDPGWTMVYSTGAANGGDDFIEFPSENARYVMMYGNERGTTWGYSLLEFEVYPGNTAPTFDVAIRNIADNELTDTITWGGISIPSPGWTVADQYLEIDQGSGYLGKGIQIYTDNQGEGANPEYTGSGSPAGLIGVTATAEVLPMCWHTEDEHVVGGPLTPVEREDHTGFTNYSWFFMGDSSSGGFNNGDDYITVWNLGGVKWGENSGERYIPVGTVMVYIAAKFEQATIQTYKTNKFILEQYHQ